MFINTLQIQNFRSFIDSGAIPLGPINIFTGPNNSGKSSVLLALYQLQQGYGPNYSDVRIGSTKAEIRVVLGEVRDIGALTFTQFFGAGELQLQLTSEDRLSGDISLNLSTPQNGQRAIQLFPNVEPNHLLVPYLSKRKTAGYTEDVRLQHAMQVTPNMTFLAAKLSRISNPGYPNHEIYKQKCTEILGFFVSTIPSANGQRPGAYLPDGQMIPIDSMGDGVPNIVGLLADLAMAKGKVFLIEEPENDLHPQALKALLDLIIESSKQNQFFVSTHSNIVVRHLASVENSKLFSVRSEFGTLPTVASVLEVEATVEARLALLRELGYTFSDFELWDGWLILEESSAERLIRDYLIPWFAPKLSRIRTISAGGVDKVQPVFEDFDRLVRFTHLEQAYRNSAWVLVDGDEKGRAITNRLQNDYSNWDKSRFHNLSSPQFENYYPSSFKDQIDQTLSHHNRQELRAAKRDLLDNVRSWLDENDARGREALDESASEVINFLKQIEKTLFG